MTRRPLASVLALFALTAAGCGGESDGRSQQPKPASARAVTPPRPTVVTTPAERGDRVAGPSRRLGSIPRPGTVKLADGPFSDRLRIDMLTLRRGRRPQVSGRMLTVTDVSEVLALTVRVAFYDRHGALVATGQRSRQHVEEFFDTPLHFRVRSTGRAPNAVAAVVTVPEYVPE